MSSLSSELYRGFRPLPSASASSFWSEESFFKISFDEMPSLHPDNEYSWIKPNTILNPPDLKSKFLTKEVLDHPALILKDTILEHIRTQIREEVLRKLRNSIENINQECEEESFDAVSNQAKENAKRILDVVYKNFPEHEYHIYPTRDCEVAIDCNPQKGKGALILFDSKGGVACFSTLEGRNSRFRCDDIADFSYDYLRKIFKKLDSKNIPIPKALTTAQSQFKNELENGGYFIDRKSSFVFETEKVY